jgi:hypothetical protein
MTTGVWRSDLQRFLAKYPELAARPEITAALDGIISLREAQKRIHGLFWKHHQNLDLLWVYGEFLYLSGYDTHPDQNVNRFMIRASNETTRTVKCLAFEQWQAHYPQGYPGYVWLHYPSEREKQTVRYIWQVSVYHQYENALTHDISNRLITSDNAGCSWNRRRCCWYREQVPYSIEYSISMIAEYSDGRLQVIENRTFDWEKEVLPIRHHPVRYYPVLPHAPAFITEQMRPGQQEEVAR